MKLFNIFFCINWYNRFKNIIKFDIIINTIPFQVLNSEKLEIVKEDVVFIDTAGLRKKSIIKDESYNNKGLQFADNVVGVIRRKLSDVDNNNFFDIISNKTIEI
mgnify:CR=1 FL=1